MHGLGAFWEFLEDAAWPVDLVLGPVCTGGKPSTQNFSVTDSVSCQMRPRNIYPAYLLHDQQADHKLHIYSVFCI